MAVCPRLTRITPDTKVITVELATELLVSTYARQIGTVVEVECYSGLKRVGPRTIECQSNLQWSGTPSCQDANLIVTTTVTSNTPSWEYQYLDFTSDFTGIYGTNSGDTNAGTSMDKEDLAVIIGSSVGSVLVLALIIFIIVVVCLGNRKTKQYAKYREPEPYREDRPFRPYSISGQKPMNENYPMYNMPTPVAIQTPHVYPVVMPISEKHHTHVETPDRLDHIHCIHCQNHEAPRRQTYICPHCTNTPKVYHRDEPRYIDTDRSLDPDIKDVVIRREIIRDGTDERSSGFQRRDGYLWRNTYDDGWRIPRPYYDY